MVGTSPTMTEASLFMASGLGADAPPRKDVEVRQPRMPGSFSPFSFAQSSAMS